MEVYLLAICDNVRSGMSDITFFLVVVVVGAVFAGFMRGTMSSDLEFRSEHFKAARVASYICIPLMLLLQVGRCAVPTTDALIRAYVLVEGSKIANAENAEAAIKWADEKIEKLINTIGEE